MVEHHVVLLLEQKGDLFPQLMAPIVVACQQNRQRFFHYPLESYAIVCLLDLRHRLENVILDYFGSHRSVEVLLYLIVAAGVVNVGQELQIEAGFMQNGLQVPDRAHREGI